MWTPAASATNIDAMERYSVVQVDTVAGGKYKAEDLFRAGVLHA
jgi:hypothetical protein